MIDDEVNSRMKGCDRDAAYEDKKKDQREENSI